MLNLGELLEGSACKGCSSSEVKCLLQNYRNGSESVNIHSYPIHGVQNQFSWRLQGDLMRTFPPLQGESSSLATVFFNTAREGKDGGRQNKTNT